LNVAENPLLIGTIPGGLSRLDCDFFFDCQPEQPCGCNFTSVAANESATATDESPTGEGLSITIEMKKLTTVTCDEG